MMQVVVITAGKTQGAALKLKEENNQLQEANHIHAVHINQNNGSSSAPQWPHNWKKKTLVPNPLRHLEKNEP